MYIGDVYLYTYESFPNGEVFGMLVCLVCLDQHTNYTRVTFYGKRAKPPVPTRARLPRSTFYIFWYGRMAVIVRNNNKGLLMNEGLIKIDTSYSLKLDTEPYYYNTLILRYK